MPDDKVKWPSNSNKSKELSEEIREKEPSKLRGSVQVKKKSVGDKISEVFVMEDIKKVCSTLLYDILVPAAKDTISKMFSNGVDMILFGDTRKRGGDIYRDRSRTYVTDYSRISRDRRDGIPQGRRRDIADIDSVRFEYREDAESVLKDLKDDLREYGRVSVKAYAYYAQADLRFDYPMSDYGWDDLSDAYVDRVRDGFILSLPRPRLIR